MFDICSACGNKRPIVNKKYNLCDSCNYLRINGKTKEQVQTIKRKQIKKKVKPLRSSKTTQIKRKNLLQKDREVYLQVFNNKPNQCEECGVYLPDEFEDENGRINYIAQYSHIITKGSSPEHRHNPENFNRLCFDCHQAWEFATKEQKQKMKIYKNNLKIINKLKCKNTNT